MASFNAACFEARAGRADEAIEHLLQAVELNDRIKELIRTDEDLDSIREDPRFDVLTRNSAEPRPRSLAEGARCPRKDICYTS